MTDVTVEGHITAPAERVWGLISDITRMGEWSPEARGGVWVKGATAPEVGARFKGKNARGRRTWSSDCRVTECEPGSRFAFSVHAGPFAVADWSYSITPTATGCLVTESWTDRRGIIIKILGTIVSGVRDRATHNREGMGQTLAALAAAVR